MTADVNVTEKVARAQRREFGEEVWGALVPEAGWTVEQIVDDTIKETLTVLSDPEVLAGIAGVLVHEIYPAHDPDECCDEWQRDHAERVATALADWLGGEE